MLKILFQDDDIVVAHKPSGYLVHRSAIDKYETRFMLQTLRNQISQSVFPVHRLDKPTSGIMIFALSADVARLMTQAFTDKEVQKTYIAVVRGWVDDQVIDYPLKEELDKMTDARAQLDKPPQQAVTHLETIDRIELPYAVGRYKTARFSLISLQPKTGRKHQIRRHLAHIRHPILGDTTHGDGKQNAFARSQLNLHRLALLAHSVNFAHPITTQQIRLHTEIDQDLLSTMSIFNKEIPKLQELG